MSPSPGRRNYASVHGQTRCHNPKYSPFNTCCCQSVATGITLAENRQNEYFNSCPVLPDIPRCGNVGKETVVEGGACRPRDNCSHRNYGYLRSRGMLRLMTTEGGQCRPCTHWHCSLAPVRNLAHCG